MPIYNKNKKRLWEAQSKTNIILFSLFNGGINEQFIAN